MRLKMIQMLFVSLAIFVSLTGRSSFSASHSIASELNEQAEDPDHSLILDLSSHYPANSSPTSLTQAHSKRAGLKGFGIRRKQEASELMSTLRSNNAALSAFESHLKPYTSPDHLLNRMIDSLRTKDQSAESLLYRIKGQTTLRLSEQGEVLPTSLATPVFIRTLRERPSLLSSKNRSELWELLLHHSNDALRMHTSESSHTAYALGLKDKNIYELQLLKNHSSSEARSFTHTFHPEWSWIFDGTTPEEKILYFARILETRSILHRILKYRPTPHSGQSAPTVFQKLENANFGHVVDIQKIKTGHASHWLISVKITKDRFKTSVERLEEFQFQMDLAKNILDLRGQHFRAVRTDYFNPHFGLLSSAVSFMTSILAERKDKAHIGVIDSFKKQFEVENRKCASNRVLVRCHYNEKIMVALANALNVFDYSTLIDRPEIYVRGR